MPKRPGQPPEAKRADSESQPRANVQQVGMMVSWEGPIPPPATLRAIDELVPGSAARLIKQFEDEANHRRSLQRKSQLFPFLDQVFARICALIFAGGCLWLIAYAIEKGAYWAAGILSAAMVVGGINAIMARK